MFSNEKVQRLKSSSQSTPLLPIASAAMYSFLDPVVVEVDDGLRGEFRNEREHNKKETKLTQKAREIFHSEVHSHV